MNIADDLVRAFNDGYEQGKADAEAYLLHCGDTDEPQTNADRVRAMTDEELEAEFWRIYEELRKWTNSRIWLHQWLMEEVKE